MALTKQSVIDKLEIVEDASIQIRTAHYILEDGARIAGPRYSRKAYFPGDTSISNEPNWVQNISDIVWTRAKIAAYQAKQSSV